MRGKVLLISLMLVSFLPPSVHTVYAMTDEPFAYHELVYTTNFTATLPEFTLELKLIRNELNTSLSNVAIQITMEDVTSEPLSISKSRNDIQVKEEGGSARILSLIFPSDVPSGTQLTVTIRGNLLPIENGEIDNSIASDVVFKLFSIVTHVPKDVRVVGLSPAAHEQATTSNSVMYRWNYVNKKFGQFNIRFIGSFSVEDLSVGLDRVVREVPEGDDSMFTLKIENSAERVVIVSVIVPKWFTLFRDGEDIGGRRGQYSIKANSTKTIEFRTLKSLKPGSYSGNVYVTYEDVLVKTIELEFEVKKSGFIPFVISLVSTIALVALGVYTLYQRRLKDEDIDVIEREIAALREPNREQRPVITTQPPSTKIPKIDYETLERLMDLRDVSVIEYIHLNGGTNQQRIASDLSISKATVSRILKRLEKRGIVRKEQNGMANRIYLNLNKIPLKNEETPS